MRRSRPFLIVRAAALAMDTRMDVPIAHMPSCNPVVCSGGQSGDESFACLRRCEEKKKDAAAHKRSAESKSDKNARAQETRKGSDRIILVSCVVVLPAFLFVRLYLFVFLCVVCVVVYLGR